MGRQYVDLRIESDKLRVDELRVLRVRATEHISRPYRVEIDIASPQGSPLEPDEVAGVSATVVLSRPDGPERRFSGLVTEMVELPQLDAQYLIYRLVLHPRVWLATLVDTFDLHLGMTVPDIVKAKLAAVEADVAMSLGGAYPEREIVTQYGETDLAFVSRLCEHLGVFFFFEQLEKGERIVFGDDLSAYRPLGEDEVVPYASRGDQVGVYELTATRRLVPSIFVCRDYNHRTPRLDLEAKHELGQGFGGGVIEFGGHFRTEEQGKQLARVRAEESLATRSTLEGKSSDIRFAPGHTFELDGHPRHSQRLVLVSVEHEAHQALLGASGTDGAERDYENRFVAIPAELTYRPPRTTRVPKIHSLVTGIVETSQGELESYAKTDDQGRYVVCFLFDTAGPDRVRASAPVRMVQSSAGPGYGVHFPLKPGVEVVLAFIDGNVDRPIIVGAVPNPITPTPVATDTSSKSRIKTRSGILIEFEDADRKA